MAVAAAIGIALRLALFQPLDLVIASPRCTTLSVTQRLERLPSPARSATLGRWQALAWVPQGALLTWGDAAHTITEAVAVALHISHSHLQSRKYRGSVF